MDTMHSDPGNQGGPAAPSRWSGRTRRIVTTAAASTLLLGTGTGIGIAMSGGAAASTAQTSPSSTASASPGAAAGSGGARASRCTRLVEQLVDGGHPRLASRLHALCTRPLLRLALVGGEHGTVTFNSKKGPITAVFERGTVESDTGSVITVTAADNTTWSWDITSSTVARQNGSKVSASGLNGDQVFVAGTVVNGANDARLIRVRAGSSSGTSGTSGTSSTSNSGS